MSLDGDILRNYVFQSWEVYISLVRLVNKNDNNGMKKKEERKWTYIQSTILYWIQANGFEVPAPFLALLSDFFP